MSIVLTAKKKKKEKRQPNDFLKIISFVHLPHVPPFRHWCYLTHYANLGGFY